MLLVVVFVVRWFCLLFFLWMVLIKLLICLVFSKFGLLFIGFVLIMLMLLWVLSIVK